MTNVYTKPGCPECVRTVTELRRRGIQFTEIDLTQNRNAYNKVTEFYGFRQAPVVETADDVWSGHQPDRIAEIEQ